jgi:hypothetical protein
MSPSSTTKSKPPRLADPRALHLPCASALWALAFGVVSPAAAQLRYFPPAVQAEQGLFCAVEPGELRAAPDTESGFINVPDRDLHMVAGGDLVPGQLGMGFGVSFTLDAPAPRLLTYVTEHPPMGADGWVRQSWTGLVQPGWIETVFYQFDHDYEVLIGDWVLSAFDGETLVYSARFKVTDPALVPRLSGLCAGGVPLS